MWEEEKWPGISKPHTIVVNPLTTIIVIQIRYQLAQSVLKIGSALAERVGQGEVGGCHPPGAVYGGSCSWL